MQVEDLVVSLLGRTDSDLAFLGHAEGLAVEGVDREELVVLEAVVSAVVRLLHLHVLGLCVAFEGHEAPLLELLASNLVQADSDVVQ